jgi:hypothetical protein
MMLGLRTLSLIALLGVAAVAAASYLALRQRGAPAADRDVLWLVPSEVDFGSVVVGSPVTFPVIATNVGAQPISLTRLHTDAPFRASGSGVTFAAGVAKEIPVIFDPEESGTFTGTLVLESEAFEGGVLEVTLRGAAAGPPEIALAPRSIAFGEVAIGGTAPALITVSNRGSSVLEVASRSVTSGFRTAPRSLSVEPGGDETLEVRFSPEREGKHTGTLRLQTNEPGRDNIVVPVGGIGVDHASLPSIEVSPAALDFGKVPVGGNAERRLTIRNVGEGPLTITSFALQAPFRSTARGRTIAPRRALSLPVKCWRPQAGMHYAPLVIASNDPGQEMVMVVLSCEGGPGAVVAQAGVDAGDTSGGAVVSQWFDAGGTSSAAAGAGLEAGASGLDATALTAGEGGAAEGDSGVPDLGLSEEVPDLGLSEESGVNLASFERPISDLSHDGVFFDPNSGWFEIRGLRLPVVDSGFSGYWMFDRVSIEGSVSAVGDFDASVPVTFYDRHGVATELVLDLTTDTAVARVDGIEMAFAGSPLQGNGMRLVGAARVPSGSLSDRLLKVVLDVQVR